MSYDANGHAAQMAMLKQLLLSPSAKFAELQKAADVTSDYANFHLRQLIGVGYVHKDKTQYKLTQNGKEYANRMDTDEKALEKQGKVAVCMLVEDGKGRILCQQRLKQPYYGYWGLLTGKIRWGETINEAAARELMEEAGLRADFELKALYHKLDYRKSDGTILEDKYFHLVHATNPQGKLLEAFEGGENHWLTLKEFKAKGKVFATIPEIIELSKKAGLHFMELKYTYDDEDY